MIMIQIDVLPITHIPIAANQFHLILWGLLTAQKNLEIDCNTVQLIDALSTY